MTKEQADKIAERLYDMSWQRGSTREVSISRIAEALLTASPKVEWPSDADSFEACREAWMDYPSQDNEGYLPDRGGFRCGWEAAIYWMRDRMRNKKEGE